MGIPLAAQPTSPTPGFWITTDLTPNTVSAGSQPIRCCILGPKSSSGAITSDTEIRSVLSQSETETSHGDGNLVSLAYAALKRRHPNCKVDVVSPAPSAGSAAVGTVAIGASTLTRDYTGRFKFQGRIIDVPWLVGETLAQFYTKAVTHINRYTKKLFCTASVGAGNSNVTLTAKTPGPVGNDIKLSFVLLDGAGAGAVTVVAFTGGSTEPDFTTALALIKGREYNFIGLCISNADAVSTSGNFAKLEAHLDSVASGPAAKLQQGVVGHTGLRTAAAVSSTARNSQVLELICAQNAQSLPSEIMGDEMGDRMEQIVLKYSKNRIGREMSPEIYGSVDPVTDHPTTVESDAALLAGLSLVGYNTDSSCKLIRAITTYCATAQGAQVLPTDCNEIDAVFLVVGDLRAFLPVTFEGVKVTRDLTDTDDQAMPEDVVEERDIRAAIVGRIEAFWIPKGVINGTKFKAACARGELIVRVNDTDETQVDMFVPLDPFKNLAKLGLYAAKVS